MVVVRQVDSPQCNGAVFRMQVIHSHYVLGVNTLPRNWSNWYGFWQRMGQEIQ